ncbi:XVIPCD domain-containing protein [Lysobacter capsici]|uniref:XVIPCD domain-containing protein n=1 Tax=Lysobacter capsici TaxID=435897 RepID=UPI000716572D|nr:XVIPCD domain-containing protein [Lysobacter capsici]
MARPNKQLSEAVDRLSDDPHATRDHIAQLRNALASDSELLDRMNDEAKLGHIKAFVIGEQGPAGYYDIQSGTVTLPAVSFRPAGVSDSGDLAAVLKLQDMSIRFGNSVYADTSGHKIPVSQEMLGNLQRAINDSPVLAAQMKTAVSAVPDPHLIKFEILDAGFGAGATYDGDSKSISIPAARLQNTSATNREGFDPFSMVYTLAHETQHGFNHTAKRKAYDVFDREVREIARDRSPINDYTAPIGRLIGAGRQDEAKAEIAGWNAVVSMVKQVRPEADLDVIGQMQNIRGHLFVEKNLATRKFEGRPGLAFGPELSLEPTAANIETLGKNYFDRFPAGTPGKTAREVSTLGPHREADYANYYGRNAIERLITIDRKHARAIDGVEPQMHIDMAALRLNERLIERLGLEIDPRPEQRQPYYDTSRSPFALQHFDHTKTGRSLNQHVPIDAAVLADDPVAVGRERLTPREQGHPDHGLYSQIATQVRQQDQKHGRQWDETSERMTASLLVLAKENGLSQVDHVVFSTNKERVAAGENVFVVQGRLDDPAHLRAHMKTDEAVRTPEAASFEKVEAINERMARQTAQAQALGQMPEEAPKGPGMGR